ncbi:hypothetical protein MJO28_001176 [Puccinia striiformis f. sp. tritici]|uniref:Uncharacterized protein n=1 Tax=Puccinia striiformis f. sp. tritici TaxID=168172 RepID=A0ACC0F008_9BASI|nr:hypothetical protein MJO28_001176 [Puccinia striiformis f. sp. tritici]KAI7966792.1 hypothetical protein MJO29_000069 [Puccinia striiformis f. sp. tritici]
MRDCEESGGLVMNLKSATIFSSDSHIYEIVGWLLRKLLTRAEKTHHTTREARLLASQWHCAACA